MPMEEAEEKLLTILKQVMEEKLTCTNVEVCGLACTFVRAALIHYKWFQVRTGEYMYMHATVGFDLAHISTHVNY